MTLTILTTVAAALVAPAPADTADAAFYRAFYLENALRDVAEAEKAYAAAATAAREEKRADLEVRALVARGKCLERLGRVEEAKAAIDAAVAVDPNSALATEASAALEKPSAGEAHLRVRLDAGLGTLAEPSATDAARRSAIEEIVLLGRRDVPRLEMALRFGGLASASGVAEALARIGTSEALDALAKALRDPDFAYVPPVIAALDYLRSGPDDLAVFEAALLARTVRERVNAATELLKREYDPSLHPRLEAALVRLASDSDYTVRFAAYRFFKMPAIAAAALRIGLSRPEESDRREAALRSAATAELANLMADDLFAVLRNDPSEAVRERALRSIVGFSEGSRGFQFFLDEERRRAALLVALEGRSAALEWGALQHIGERSKHYSLADPSLHASLFAALRRRLGQPLSGTEPHLLDGAIAAFAPSATDDEVVSLFALAGSATLDADERRVFRQRLLGALDKRAGLRDDAVPEAERARRARALLALARPVVADDHGIALLLAAIRGAKLPFADVYAESARSESPDVRREAYAGLVAPGLQRPSGLSLPHLGDDITAAEQQLRSWAQSLAFAEPDMVDADDFRRLLREGSKEEVGPALTTLVQVAGRDALPEVRAALRSDDNVLRLVAARLIVKLEGDAGVDEIIEVARAENDFRFFPIDLLRDEPGTISPAAVERFVNAMPPTAWDSAIVDYLDDAARRRVIVEALSRPWSSQLIRIVQTAGRWHVREAWPRLLTLTEHPNDDLRNAARAALEQIEQYERLQASFERFGSGGREKAIADARALLASPDAAKRRGAVLALGALEDAGAVPLLLQRLDDEDAAVREAALGALERLGGKPRPKDE